MAPFQPENTKQADQAVQQFRTISAMPAYADKSPEELRLEDYSNNCKGAPGGQLYPTMHPSKAGGTGVLLLRHMQAVVAHVDHFI